MSLYDYQSKANRYRKRLTYLKNRATTNQKYTLDSQKPKTELEIIKPHTKKEKGGNKESIRNKV